ncbi:hypothetical protein [Dasania marina]|uniref:hypothetical protein n=1 Tax=Dasania marina TaxID=471499 RepID=UPI0004B8F294|nr:hypothetical protein [Dasania marina]
MAWLKNIKRPVKKLHLRHLSPECHQLLKKAGSMYEVNVLENSDYHVATDTLG